MNIIEPGKKAFIKKNVKRHSLCISVRHVGLELKFLYLSHASDSLTMFSMMLMAI